MNQDRKDFLMLPTKPARLTITEAAWYFGFSEQDISVLVSAGHLKPLGHPPRSGSKHFATVELEKLRTDSRWLARACDILVSFWRHKNASRARRNGDFSEHVA
jgi:hypothetical protein